VVRRCLERSLGAVMRGNQYTCVVLETGLNRLCKLNQPDVNSVLPLSCGSWMWRLTPLTPASLHSLTGHGDTRTTIVNGSRVSSSFLMSTIRLYSAIHVGCYERKDTRSSDYTASHTNQSRKFLNCSISTSARCGRCWATLAVHGYGVAPHQYGQCSSSTLAWL